MDIDEFKKVNAEFGREFGDKIIKNFCIKIAKSLKKGNFFGRIGGEEFIIILPDADEKLLNSVINDVKAIIEEIKQTLGQPTLQLTMSIGATFYKPSETVDETFKRVDLALYKAKSAGKNNVQTL